MNDPQWLLWARRLQAISQTGLTTTFGSLHPADVERYAEVQRIAAEITAMHTELSVERLIELFELDQGFATPKIAVRAAVFQDDAILLVQEKRDFRWTIPGGYADVNDSPSEGAAREVLEETGFAVEPQRLLAVYDRMRHPHGTVRFRHLYTLFFDCELIGKVQEASTLETSGCGFFTADALPPLWEPPATREMAQEHRTHARDQILRLFELHNDPTLPPDFD
jgi:ADP-ribose pyrophosphatase YjhB (NUDIX family)